jgi:hypothetical protein
LSNFDVYLLKWHDFSTTRLNHFVRTIRPALTPKICRHLKNLFSVVDVDEKKTATSVVRRRRPSTVGFLFFPKNGFDGRLKRGRPKRVLGGSGALAEWAQAVSKLILR